MKFIKYTLLLFCMMSVLYACKKDLGNYTYTEVDIPKTDTTAIALVYNVEQFSNLTINPTIKYGGDTSNLSYQWLTYIKSLSSVTVGVPTVISTQRNLNLEMKMIPGAYYLELVITDKSNGAKSTSRTLLNVLASMETGWLVLHSTNAESDIDFIASKNLSNVGGIGVEKRIRNLFQTITGSRMKGEGQMIGYSRRSNSLFNWITVGTDQSIKRMNGFSFADAGTDNELFRRPLTAKNFQGHLNNGGFETLINDGQLYTQSWSVAQDALYFAPFGGDYYLAPYVVVNDYSPFGPLVYDQKNGKFRYCTTNLANLVFSEFKPAAGAGQAFSPSNVGKDLLFMDRGFGKNAFAFFKDKTGNGRWLYVLDMNQFSDVGNLALAAYDMTALPEITDAKFFQVGDLGNVALYATDKTVYRFDYSGTKTATVSFSGLPANEVITCMRIFKPVINQNSTSSEFTLTNNAVVYIATWDGTQGKLYELAMNVASGVINPVPLKTYDGFGKIKDMIAKFRGTGI